MATLLNEKILGNHTFCLFPRLTFYFSSFATEFENKSKHSGMEILLMQTHCVLEQLKSLDGAVSFVKLSGDFL